MLENIQIVILLVAGIVGTLLSIALGWSESSEDFNVKKFISSLIRGSLGAVLYVIGTYASAATVTVWDYIVVLVFAAGFEALLKRGQGTAELKLSGTTTETVTSVPARIKALCKQATFFVLYGK